MGFDVIVLAEAAAVDARGALTLIGVNQRVLAPATIPFNIKQRLIGTLTDELPESAGHGFGEIPDGIVSVRVINPEGDTTFSASEEVALPPSAKKRWADLPLTANLIVEIDIKGDSYGVYVVEVTYKPIDSAEKTRRIPLYIVAPDIAFGQGPEPGDAFKNSNALT
jgi:hypothetical protein